MCWFGYNYYSSSLRIPVNKLSYSSVCGQVRGHELGLEFLNAINCKYSLDQPYVEGISLTHVPAGRRRHIGPLLLQELMVTHTHTTHDSTVLAPILTSTGHTSHYSSNAYKSLAFNVQKFVTIISYHSY